MSRSPVVTRRLQRPPGSGRRGSQRQAYVVVLAGERMGEVFPLKSGRTTLGRGVTTDIRLGDEGISRTHAAVLFEGDVYYLTDAGSTNGTYANGERVERYPLREGDRIQLGAASVLRFTYYGGGGRDHDSGSQRQIYETTLRDPLTGLFNDGYLRNRLESDVAAALRHGKPLSLVLFVVDHHDQTIAARGAVAADQLLKELARRVRENTRRDDILARRGLNGFALVCLNVDALGASRAAARIRGTVSARPFVQGGGGPISATVSLGVADLAMLPRPDAEALVDAAETALVAATHNGRDRVELYDSESDPTRHV